MWAEVKTVETELPMRCRHGSATPGGTRRDAIHPNGKIGRQCEVSDDLLRH